MNQIEIFALVIILLSAVKMITITIKPRAWFNFAKKIWKFPAFTMFASALLAIYVLSILLKQMSIVQIFAVILFVTLISMTTMAVYSKEFLDMANKLIKDRKFMKKAWLPILIWAVLIIWVGKELLI